MDNQTRVMKHGDYAEALRMALRDSEGDLSGAVRSISSEIMP